MRELRFRLRPSDETALAEVLARMVRACPGESISASEVMRRLILAEAERGREAAR